MRVKAIISKMNRLITFPLLVCLLSCVDFVAIDSPRTDLVRSKVFESDATALAAADNMYGQMIIGGFGGGYTFSYTFLGALSGDELINFISHDAEFGQFNECTILPTNSKLNRLWNEPYAIIYRANALLEGLDKSSNVSDLLKRQLIGEALFVRSFCYFYLTNLFGDVPLVLDTDYVNNMRILRTATSVVYDQIIADLLTSNTLLPESYSTSVSERVRPNTGAASALLARIYLYTGAWVNAEQVSSFLIQNETIYQLEPLSNVFLKDSKEAIWQLGKVAGGNASEGFLFNFPVSFNCSLANEFVASFDPEDLRRSAWIEVENFGVDYFYPKKYITETSTPVTKHSIVFRLAEQYLIRAEARAQQGNISGAQEDINSIRRRSGLGDTSAKDLSSLLLTIEQERKHELFTEWGHRWLDLKRTGRLDEIIGSLKPNWEPYKAFYPIPASQILNSPAMAKAQNDGYE